MCSPEFSSLRTCAVRRADSGGSWRDDLVRHTIDDLDQRLAGVAVEPEPQFVARPQRPAVVDRLDRLDEFAVPSSLLGRGPLRTSSIVVDSGSLGNLCFGNRHSPPLPWFIGANHGERRRIIPDPPFAWISCQRSYRQVSDFLEKFGRGPDVPPKTHGKQVEQVRRLPRGDLQHKLLGRGIPQQVGD